MMQANRTEKYQQLRAMLNEKQWRHYLVLEAQERGSVAQVAQEARVSQNTIRRGLRELEAGVRYTVGERQREEGGGRKHVVAETTIRRLLHAQGYSLRANKRNCLAILRTMEPNGKQKGKQQQ